MGRKILIVTLDGTAPAYLDNARTPNLDALARGGFRKTGNCVMPSVTNVNNVSIMTGEFPSEHGIASNYSYDPATGEGHYIETSELRRVPTALARARSAGMTTALLTAKVKLLRMLEDGADWAIAAEAPTGEWVSRLGAPPPVYSGEINIWLLRACHALLRDRDPDIAYCSTTDYLQHQLGPEHEAARRHVEEVDTWLGEIAALDPSREIYVTADHGMNFKTRIINLQVMMDRAHLKAVCVPIIKDRYLAHHPYQEGGSLNVYLKDGTGPAEVREWLLSQAVVDAVYSREEAVQEFHLPGDRIGDLFVLGVADVAFGEQPEAELRAGGRSHGSMYEREIPLIAYHPSAPADSYSYNMDMVRNLGI